jgi:hypothetical protein
LIDMRARVSIAPLRRGRIVIASIATVSSLLGGWVWVVIHRWR